VVAPGPEVRRLGGAGRRASGRNEARGRVLELACGSGRVTIPLVRAGREVTGLDDSPSMLAACRDKATAVGVAVDAAYRSRVPSITKAPEDCSARKPPTASDSSGPTAVENMPET